MENFDTHPHVMECYMQLGDNPLQIHLLNMVPINDEPINDAKEESKECKNSATKKRNLAR
jgi:hypothetical protein